MNNSSKTTSNAVFHFVSDNYSFIVENSCTLGRTRADIIIKDEKLSSIHCEFILKNSGVYLVDNDSRNGTFLNNEQLEAGKVTKLKVGDKLKLGSNTYLVKYGITLIKNNAQSMNRPSDDNMEESSNDESVDALYEEAYGDELKKEKKPLEAPLKDNHIEKNKVDKKPEKVSSKEIKKPIINDFFIFKIDNFYDFFGILGSSNNFFQKYSFFNIYWLFLIVEVYFLYTNTNQLNYSLFLQLGDVIPKVLYPEYERSILTFKFLEWLALYFAFLIHAYVFKFKVKTKVLANNFVKFISLFFLHAVVFYLVLAINMLGSSGKIEKYSFLRYTVTAMSIDSITKNEDVGIVQAFHDSFKNLSKSLSFESKDIITNDYNQLRAEFDFKKVWHVSAATNDLSDNIYISGSVVADTSSHRLQGISDSFILKLQSNDYVSWIKFIGEFGLGMRSLNTVIDKMDNVYVFAGSKPEKKTSKSLIEIRHLVKYLSSGDISWEKKFSESDNFGAYIGSGITKSGFLYILCKKKNEPNVDIIKFFTQDGELKSTLESTGTTTNTNQVLVSDNDEIITAGKKQDQIIISKRDLTGKLLKEDTFTDIAPSLTKIYQDNEENIYILGVNHPFKEATARRQLFVYKLNSDGSRPLKTYYSGNNFMTFGADLKVDSHSHLIVSGIDLDYSLTDLSRRYYRLITLVFDQKLKLLKEIDGPKAKSSFYPYQMIEDSNKTIHIFGNITDPSSVHIAHPDYDFFHYKLPDLDDVSE